MTNIGEEYLANRSVVIVKKVGLLQLILDVVVDVEDVGDGTKNDLHLLSIKYGSSWLVWLLYLFLEHLCNYWGHASR